MSSFRPLTDEPSDPLVKRSKRGPNSINHSNVLNQISSSRLNLPPMNETLKTYDNNVSGATSSGPNSSHNSSLNGNFQAQDRVLSTPVRLSSPQTPITFPTQRTTPVQNNSYTTLHGTTLSTPFNRYPCPQNSQSSSTSTPNRFETPLGTSFNSNQSQTPIHLQTSGAESQSSITEDDVIQGHAGEDIQSGGNGRGRRSKRSGKWFTASEIKKAKNSKWNQDMMNKFTHYVNAHQDFRKENMNELDGNGYEFVARDLSLHFDVEFTAGKFEQKKLSEQPRVLVSEYFDVFLPASNLSGVSWDDDNAMLVLNDNNFNNLTKERVIEVGKSKNIPKKLLEKYFSPGNFYLKSIEKFAYNPIVVGDNFQMVRATREIQGSQKLKRIQQRNAMKAQSKQEMVKNYYQYSSDAVSEVKNNAVKFVSELFNNDEISANTYDDFLALFDSSKIKASILMFIGSQNQDKEIKKEVLLRRLKALKPAAGDRDVHDGTIDSGQEEA